MVANMQVAFKVYILLNRLLNRQKCKHCKRNRFATKHGYVIEITADKMCTFMQKLLKVFGWQTQHVANKAYQSDQQQRKQNVENV